MKPMRMVETLIRILEYRDVYTRGHTERGVFLALRIAQSIGLSKEEMRLLELGGKIHDIGKIGIPDVILLKPSSLTKEEFEVMKLHVMIGYEMLKNANIPKESMDVLLYHQERYDGKGYPHGAKGEEIPFLARIYAVADAFEAMTARRIYKKAKTWEVALNELEELSGAQFDPYVVKHAIKAIKSIDSVPIVFSEVDVNIEKIRWSFNYMDATGAIKGDLFLSSLKAFIEQRDSFCLTVFDIEDLSKINMELGWEKGNEALRGLVTAINIQCCSSEDIRDVIIKLMREDVVDIDSPVVFRIGGDEFAVIAPYIPPPEKVEGVVKFMKQLSVSIRYLQMKYPYDFKSYDEVIKKIVFFTKHKILERYGIYLP